MRFSLILCTINRVQVVREYLQSLAEQKNPPSFEVILVDQNPDERLMPVIHDFENRFLIRRLLSAPGLSRARNIGLQEAAGDIIAFPDDDCTYPPELLRQISDFLQKKDTAGGISVLEADKNGMLSGCYMRHVPAVITHKNVWHCAISSSIFLKRSAIGEIRFDETLGVGSGTRYGSGEETDFLLQLIEAGSKLEFYPEYVVHHPVFKGPWIWSRAYRYGCGMGRVLCLHHYNILHLFWYAGLQGVRAILSLCRLQLKKMVFHLIMSAGRITGYILSLKDRKMQ